MDLITFAVWALWFAAIVARMGALAALVARGMYTRYPLLSLTLLVGSLRSFLLLFARFQWGPAGYNSIWISSEPISLALDAGLVLGLYLMMIRQAPGEVGVFAVVMAVVFAVIASVVVIGTAGWLDVHTHIPLVIVISHHFAFGCVLFLWLAYGTCQFYQYRFTANTDIHTLALTILFGGATVATQLRQLDEYWTNTAGQFTLLGSAILAYLIWMTRLKRTGEVRPAPLPPISEEEYRAGEDAWERAIRRVREALRNRLHLPSVF